MSAPEEIVTRLRIKDGVYTEFWQQKLMDEAADEIERLRAENNALQLQVVAQAIDTLGTVHK
jgi:hypothetical protein